MKESDFAKVRRTAVLKSDVIAYTDGSTGFGGDAVKVTMRGGTEIVIDDCTVSTFENALYGRVQPVE